MTRRRAVVSPDCVCFKEAQDKKRVSFVMETKGKARGTNRTAEEAKIGCAEKRFEALGLGPSFRYDVEVEYRYARAL